MSIVSSAKLEDRDAMLKDLNNFFTNPEDVQDDEVKPPVLMDNEETDVPDPLLSLKPNVLEGLTITPIR